MKSIAKIIKRKKLETKESIAKFLVGKTVKIISKRNENNYGDIGDIFVIDKVENFDPTELSAQFKDFRNKIYLSDITFHNENERFSIWDRKPGSLFAHDNKYHSMYNNIYR